MVHFLLNIFMKEELEEFYQYYFCYFNFIYISMALFITRRLIDFSKSSLYSLGFSSNLYFWYSGQQYGAESDFNHYFIHGLYQLKNNII